MSNRSRRRTSAPRTPAELRFLAELQKRLPMIECDNNGQWFIAMMRTDGEDGVSILKFPTEASARERFSQLPKK